MMHPFNRRAQYLERKQAEREAAEDAWLNEGS
jgi:hypothetical protein